MNETLTFLLLFLMFWLTAYALGRKLPLGRYGLEIQPFLMKWRSESFRKILYGLSYRWGRIWKIFSWIGMFIGFGLMALAIAFLSWNLIKAALKEGFSSITPIIPGLTLRLYWLPYFLIAAIVTIFAHEAAHGIIAINGGINIKSAGTMLLAIFPGGFVELDERDLEAAPLKTKVKIYSAGSASNVILGLIMYLVLVGLFVQNPAGLVVLEVLEGGPLQRAGIGPWDAIYALNGREVRTLEELREFMLNVRPGDEIIVSTSKGNIVVRAAPSPDGGDRAIIGLVSSIPYHPSRFGLGHIIDTQLYLMLNWLFIVLMSVAIFNMLPIPYLDGDKMLQCLTERAPVMGGALRRALNMLSIFLLLANIFASSI